MRLLAIDIGSGSGRGMLGTFDEAGRLASIEEVARFTHGFIRINGTLYWDYVGIYRGVLEILRSCRCSGIVPDCIGIDAWAQDYAYVGSNGEVLGLPRSYRDPITRGLTGVMERDLGIDPPELARLAGGFHGTINTRCQLWYDKFHRGDLFEHARHFLFMPYLVAYLLTGRQACDPSLTSIGGLNDVRTQRPSDSTLRLMGISDLLPPCLEPGTLLGYTNRSVFEETGLDSIPVACVEGHDTSSAVSAIPDDGEFLWVSSGSYNMLGMVQKTPEIRDEALRLGYNYTPLRDGRTCLMMGGGAGMYHVQMCMKQWHSRGVGITYPGLTEYAVSHFTDRWFDFADVPDDSIDMPSALRAAAKKQGFDLPDDPYEIYEAFCNSLAKLTSEKLTALEQRTGRAFDRVYIVSGGSQADGVNLRMGRRMNKAVYAGLREASAIGSLFAQRAALDGNASPRATAEELGEFNMKRRA